MDSATDDDGKPLFGIDSPFIRLPDRPKNWRDGLILLQLSIGEAAFLRERLSHVRRKESDDLSLLARLVRTEAAAPESMWADEVRSVSGVETSVLTRAEQAASLAGIGRAVYGALLERMIEVHDKRSISTRHCEHLAAVVGEHGDVASKLDISALENDIGRLTPKLRDVLVETKRWIASKADPVTLHGVFTAAESRKGQRARLPLTPNGRARRIEWSSDEHGLAGPLHYRWAQVRTLLNDLAEAE
jgi:hypothetical protein